MIDRGRASPLVAALLLAWVVGGFWMLRVHFDPPPRAASSIHDIGRYFYPAAVNMHRDLRGGTLSLWNPYQMAGMPLLATQQAGQLYPPNLVLLSLLPAELALEALAVLHLFIAGFFTWLFTRRLKLGFAASMCAAVTYMLSGAMLAMFYAVAYVATCAWLPAVVWATHRLVLDARPREAAILSIALSLAFLGGHAQGFVFEVQFGAAYGLTLLLLRSPASRWPRTAMLGILSAVLLAGLVAAQLLPSLELLLDVRRAAEGLSLAEAGEFSAEPAVVLRGLIGEGTRFATTVLALPLIACGLLDRRRRSAWLFFATAALVTGLFALGDRTPVFRIYHALPGGDLFRFPYRIAFVYTFCLSVLAAIGVAGVQQWLARSRPDLRRLPGAIATLIVLVVIGDFHAPGHLQYALPIPPEKSRGAPDALLAELESRRLEGRAFNENFGFQYSIVMPYLFGMMNQTFTVPTYEPMSPRAYAEYFGQDRLWRGFVNVVPPTGFSYGSSAEPKMFPPGGLARLLDLMSVRFYTAHEQLAKGRLGELERFAGGVAKRFDAAYMVERRQALPRAYVVHQQIVEPDPKLAWQRLLKPSFAPDRQAVLERSVSGLEPAASDAREVERTRIRAYESARVAIEARCSTACLLVLTDLDYPGWEARVDGDLQAIMRVNTLFRGLLLGPGLHQVEYLYRPRSFRIGAALTISTLALLLVAGGFAIARRESEAPDQRTLTG
ncbi:MAG: YfhO family protein [Myxococcota bacterium]